MCEKMKTPIHPIKPQISHIPQEDIPFGTNCFLGPIAQPINMIAQNNNQNPAKHVERLLQQSLFDSKRLG